MIEIDESIRAAVPGAALAAVRAEVKVQRTDPAVERLALDACNLARESISLEGLHDLSEISTLRAAYRLLGKDPSRYRGSAEALLRRVLGGKALYQINTLVDINNVLSIETKYPVGTYNLENVQGDIVFRVGRPGETYQGIGKELINLDGLPLFADAAGPFGSPTSDSNRTKIELTTTKALLVIISFEGPSKLADHASRAADLLEHYAGAREITSVFINTPQSSG